MKLLEYLLSTPASDPIEGEKENFSPGIVTSVPSVPQKQSQQCPGPDVCAGCYSIGVLDGVERFIHPPKVSAAWLEWLARWEPGEKTQ